MLIILAKILGVALLAIAGVAAVGIAFVAVVSALSDGLGTDDEDQEGGR